MNSKIFFNGKQTELSFAKIKEHVDTYGSFSGSIEAGNTMFLFNNVKPTMFDYYVHTFNTQIKDQPETEVTFDIRTNVIKTVNL